MTMNCNIADDLLPLYMEDACSQDSRTALEEHLAQCSACREKLERMRKKDPVPALERDTAPKLFAYAKKIRRRRIVLGILGVLVFDIALLCGLVLMDMRVQANPTVFEVEEGTVNLTADSMTTNAEQVEQLVFYTNTTRIQVTVEADGDFQGKIILRQGGDAILFGSVDRDNNSCTFSNLTARLRYQVRCEGLEGATVTVSDGRVVSFWQGLKNVLGIS